MELSLEKNITIALSVYLAGLEGLKRLKHSSTECRSSKMLSDGARSLGLAMSMAMKGGTKARPRN